MILIRENIKILFLLILPIHFFIAQNSLLNKHTHFYVNSIVVTHSHPVDTKNGKPIQDHNHTKTEICLFHCLNFDYYTFSSEININFHNNAFSENYIINNDSANISIYQNFTPLRAPPILV